MSDLISRSELLKSIDEEAKKIPIDAEKYHIDTNIIDGMNATLKAITNIIKEQPTAYDVDKAVKELEDYLGDTNFEKSTKDVNESFYKGMSFAYGKAIEIVKQGSVSDDVCEWRKDGLFLYTSCGNRVDAYSDDFKYCPYCSKRIKIVDSDK